MSTPHALSPIGIYRFQKNGPGFGVPIFEMENAFYKQMLSSEGSVVSFCPCEFDTDLLPFSEKDIIITVGGTALFVFVLEDGSIMSGTKKELAREIRPHFPSLQSFPYVYWDVAEFCEDNNALAEAKELCNEPRTSPMRDAGHLQETELIRQAFLLATEKWMAALPAHAPLSDSPTSSERSMVEFYDNLISRNAPVTHDGLSGKRESVSMFECISQSDARIVLKEINNQLRCGKRKKHKIIVGTINQIVEDVKKGDVLKVGECQQLLEFGYHSSLLGSRRGSAQIALFDKLRIENNRCRILFQESSSLRRGGEIFENIERALFMVNGFVLGFLRKVGMQDKECYIEMAGSRVGVFVGLNELDRALVSSQNEATYI